MVCNLANCDMVGHTGVLEAAVKAVEAVDEAVRVIVEAALEQDGFVLLCADHGNAECMIAQDGTPMTAPHGKSRAAHCRQFGRKGPAGRAPVRHRAQLCWRFAACKSPLR